MLHGFDSSLLEFRRLLPKLEDLGAEVYAVDVLGWGFTQLAGVSSFGAGSHAVLRLASPFFSSQRLHALIVCIKPEAPRAFRFASTKKNPTPEPPTHLSFFWHHIKLHSVFNFPRRQPCFFWRLSTIRWL